MDQGRASISVPHVVRGRFERGGAVSHGRFATPKLDLDALAWPRSEPGPAFETPIREVIDFLVEVGRALAFDRNPWLQEALEASLSVNDLGRRILETTYRGLPHLFERDALAFQVEQEVGWGAIDGWAEVRRPDGRIARVRAFPPRLVHVLAGNTPAVTAATIVRGALSKGVHLLKLPSNDLFTASALLRSMALVDPDHPTLRSFSAVYWRGGDESVESPLLRAQFFDKLVVWGGEGSVRGALRYAGPGFEVVSFDPKVSISLVGREALATEAARADAADRAAADVALLNQDSCASSRFVFVEGEADEVDAFCAQLALALRQDRPLSDGLGPVPSADLLGEVDGLRTLAPYYRVFGEADGGGLVIRSEDPVDFQLSAKTVNVVPVAHLADAVHFANVATQTVGVLPSGRVAELRDALASAGVQRIVTLGEIARHGVEGLPHDGFYPIRRFMRWVLDDAA
jgi:hypothetical protein